MSVDYEVIDDFLPSEVHKELSSLISSDGFPFYFSDFIVDKEINNDNFFFSHMLYNNGAVSSWYFNNIANHFLERLRSVQLIRMKVNAYVRDVKNTVHGFHYDSSLPHKIALWSLNTNNGFTLLRDQDTGQDIKINSVANRMVLFSGSTLHSSASQTDEKLRINININYL